MPWGAGGGADGDGTVTISPVLYASDKMDWETPQWLFDLLDEEFDFELDVCATHENRKCSLYYTKEIDALAEGSGWLGVAWCNPPYGREIRNWVKKAYEESVTGATVVLLIPARTDTAYYHDYIWPYACEMRFIRGRLKFVGGSSAAPFPSVVVVFRPDRTGPPQVSTIEKP